MYKLLFSYITKKKKPSTDCFVSPSPSSISAFMSDFDVSDYAFVGDIYQVRHDLPYAINSNSHNIRYKLIPFDGEVNMETNPYITITGSVTKFDSEDRSFTMTPTQYVILTHTQHHLFQYMHISQTALLKRDGAQRVQEWLSDHP